MQRYWTGVGSSTTPPDVQQTQTKIGECLARAGLILLSGGAVGSDSAFERGVGDKHLIFYGNTRHKTLHGYASIPRGAGRVLIEDGPLAQRAEQIVQHVLEPDHWRNITRNPFVRNLIRRNVFQVLGPQLNTPTEFLVCWAKPEGDSIHGGTKSAYELARLLGIPTYNLIDGNDRARLSEHIRAGVPPPRFDAVARTMNRLVEFGFASGADLKQGVSEPPLTDLDLRARAFVSYCYKVSPQDVQRTPCIVPLSPVERRVFAVGEEGLAISGAGNARKSYMILHSGMLADGWSALRPGDTVRISPGGAGLVSVGSSAPAPAPARAASMRM